MKYIAIPAVMIVFIVASCSSPSGKPAERRTQAPGDSSVLLTAVQVKQAGIETGLPEKQTIEWVLNVNGVVDVPPQNIVSVSFPMGGYLKTTRLLPGMHVARGEVIGIVEDHALVQLQQDYLMAREKLAYLQQEFDRQQALSDQQVNAQKTFQQVRSEYGSQKVLVKGYGEKLRLIGIDPAGLDEKNISGSVAIHSPINGFVSKVNVNIGRYVNPTDVLFELINPGDMHAALTVFEKDIAKVLPGQKVKIAFVDNPRVNFDGEVILVSRNVDENRSALVHCHFQKQPSRLLPGMFLHARIVTGKAEAFTVPESAVVRYENKEYVFEAAAGNRFVMRMVATGIAEQGRVAIAAGDTDFSAMKLVTVNAYAVLSKLKNAAEE